jgi:hypothetical protein
LELIVSRSVAATQRRGSAAAIPFVSRLIAFEFNGAAIQRNSGG